MSNEFRSYQQRELKGESKKSVCWNIHIPILSNFRHSLLQGALSLLGTMKNLPFHHFLEVFWIFWLDKTGEKVCKIEVRNLDLIRNLFAKKTEKFHGQIPRFFHFYFQA